VSQANVELVVRLQPAPDVDIGRLFREDDLVSALAPVVARFFHPDFECALYRLDDAKTYTGLDGLRTLWLDWLTPWATYRTEIEEAIDCGDRVLLLFHDFGRRAGSTDEVRGNVAAIWTVRGGKIARAEFYPSRDDALKAVGLEE
jgi:ketosteroid isomerase-like protein